MTAPTLFDLDEPIHRPVWSTVPCHECGEPLRRFVRQSPNSDWYQYELHETAWAHLRAHRAAHRAIRL